MYRGQMLTPCQCPVPVDSSPDLPKPWIEGQCDHHSRLLGHAGADFPWNEPGEDGEIEEDVGNDGDNPEVPLDAISYTSREERLLVPC